MPDSLRVGITKTKREWKVIDKRIKELLNNADISHEERYRRYLNLKISLLIADYEKCPDCVRGLFPPKNPQRKNTISPVWHERLLSISEDLEVSISTILDRVILTPLLIEK